jgi:hypothetical protein
MSLQSEPSVPSSPASICHHPGQHFAEFRRRYLAILEMLLQSLEEETLLVPPLAPASQIERQQQQCCLTSGRYVCAGQIDHISFWQAGHGCEYTQVRMESKDGVSSPDRIVQQIASDDKVHGRSKGLHVSRAPCTTSQLSPAEGQKLRRINHKEERQ